MDPRQFDSLARSFAAPKTRRGLLGALAALGAGLLGARAADAQVTQAQCGNVLCGTNPGVCKPGCVCCVYPNGNSRCRPPQDCAAPGTVATTTTTAAPVCTTHADCNDGNACTVDLCGPTSHQCHHISVSDTCVQCTGDAQCSGGTCCHGRCCPAGSGCQLAATGEPICCPDCDGNGVTDCCDVISYSCGAGSCGYDIGPARCIYGTGNCAACPPICSTANCVYEVGQVPGGTPVICGARTNGDGSVTPNICTPFCVKPAGQVF